MFDKMPLPSIPVRPFARRAGRRHSSNGIPWLILGLAVVASGVLVAVSPFAARAADPDQPSVQYQEALEHAGKAYAFKPGGKVTVPYKPRIGDSTLVDGEPPVALPAAAGVASPNTSAQTVTPNVAPPLSGLLRRETYGFLPYWSLGTGLNYDALSTIAYFGVWMNGDGSITKSGNGWNGWQSTTLTNTINAAHTHGTRVALTVESFAYNSSDIAAQTALLSNPAARAVGIANIVSEVTNRGVDGVNLDFEPIASGQSANFVSFVHELRTALDAAHPGYELTFCSTGSGGSYNLSGLLSAGGADAVFIMAYDLRGSSPSTTGSIDPLVSNYAHYTLTSITNYFTTHGAAPSQILMGLPWEGRAWSTGPAAPTLNAAPANITTYGQGAVGVSYQTSVTMASKDPANTSQCQPGWPVPCVIGWQYDPLEQTAWTAYYGNYGGTQNTWRELYFDDTRSFGAKCDAVDAWNLRGVGIWELGLDDDNLDLTSVLLNKFLGVPATYTPVAPARLLDSRSGIGFSGVLQRGKPRQLQVVGAAGGVIPAGATAVTGNLTVTGQTGKGFLYIGPIPLVSPPSSTLNFPVGDNRANGLSVPLGTDGSVWITYVASTSGATTNVVFDVTGYFKGDMTGATYHPVAPTRVLDSRSAIGMTGKLASRHSRTFQVGGLAGVPSNAIAVTGNLTVTQQTARGYIYAGPDMMDWPNSSTLNFPKGDNRANGLTSRLRSDGALALTYVAGTSDTTDVIFDVTGYYTQDTSGLAYVALPPARILDTRAPIGLVGALSTNHWRTFQVTYQGHVPGIATAVTGNLTVTGQTTRGYLYLGPIIQDYPTSSTLNFPVGDNRANGVTVGLKSDGSLVITFAGGPGSTTHAVFDVTGYFIPVSPR